MSNLTAGQAKATLKLLEHISKEERAMAALEFLFGKQVVKDLYEEPGSEEHDNAWSALTVLENHVEG